jgi:hypothetical protein
MPRLVAVLVTTVALSAPACGSAEQARRSAEETSTQEIRMASRHGLRIGLPSAWYGRIYVNETGLRVVQAANFRLAERDDDVGSKTLQRMGSDGVLIAIWYWADRFPPDEDTALLDATLPLEIARSDFGKCTSLGAPETAMRAVAIDGHLIQVLVSFGSARVSDKTLADANRVLATFSIP